MARRRSLGETQVYQQDLGMSCVDAARERILQCYHDFDIPIVSFSGGKDSLALLLLTIETMRPLGKKPVVLFVDEEFVPNVTVDFVKFVMYESEWASSLIPLWGCWQLDTDIWVGKEVFAAIQWDAKRQGNWMRDIPPYALTDFEKSYDIYSTAIPIRRVFSTASVIMMTGVRADESVPRRAGLIMAMRAKHKYMWIANSPTKTAGVKHGKPIYDWKRNDVLKFLSAHNLINPIYSAWLLSEGIIGRVNSPIFGRRCNLPVYKKIDPDFCDRLCAVVPELHAALVLDNQVKSFKELADQAMAKYGASWAGLAEYIKQEYSDGEIANYARRWFRRQQKLARGSGTGPAIDIETMFKYLASANYGTLISPGKVLCRECGGKFTNKGSMLDHRFREHGIKKEAV